LSLIFVVLLFVIGNVNADSVASILAGLKILIDAIKIGNYMIDPVQKCSPIIYEQIVAVFGKEIYGEKVKEQEDRFVVNVVGGYNVGKTYVLKLLTNINIGHSLTEQEIAFNSADIFVLVVNQMTLDDQLYLKALTKRLKVYTNRDI